MSQSSSAALLDTDILSALMRQHPAATARAHAYLVQHHRLTFSIITRYELLRGLFVKNAAVQLAAFDQLCNVSDVLPLSEPIVVRAASIYADLHQRGALIGDGDILIAATAIEHGLVVVTNNLNHFQRISGVQL